MNIPLKSANFEMNKAYFAGDLRMGAEAPKFKIVCLDHYVILTRPDGRSYAVPRDAFLGGEVDVAALPVNQRKAFTNE